MMPTPQILKQIILICLWSHHSTRLISYVVAKEWMAHLSGMRMVYFASHTFNGLYFWLGFVLPSWRSINGGRTKSMLGTHYLRILPPPWFLCFAWKPKDRTLKLCSGFLQWWGMVLSSPVWWLSLGGKELSNLYSSNSIALNLDFWVSSEHLIIVRYYPLPEIYEFNSSIRDLPFNDYINGKLSLIFLKSISTYSCLAIFSSVLCSFNLYLSTCWVQLVVFMAPKEKTKPKKTFKNTLLNRSDPVSSNEINTDGSVIKPKHSSFVEEPKQTGNGDFHPIKAGDLKKLEKGESSKTPKKMDAASFFNKLSKEDIVANQHYFEEINKERELEAAHANLFYYQEDEKEPWLDGQGDYLQDLPYEEENMIQKIEGNPFPELAMEDSSFQSLHSDNSMLKHLADMELKRLGQSTSGSGKRKNMGGDGDTASSSMVETKKPKI